jgi:DNA-binding PucR family transcriptional regulator
VRTAYFADVVPLVTILELEDFFGDRPYLRSDKLGQVVEHDRTHGTLYLATLRAFLDAFGDVSKAAESMRLHPNSFRYRLRRLVDLFGLDLDDPEERLLSQLYLRCGQTKL